MKLTHLPIHPVLASNLCAY